MRSRVLAWPLLAILATLLLHGAIVAVHFPVPTFLKYPAAARQQIAGDLDSERLADFSPLYLALHVAAQKWLPEPERAILWLQVLMTALSAGLLLSLLRRHFHPLLAAAGTAVFVLDRGVMVYTPVLEPEVLLLFLLLGALHGCGNSEARRFPGGIFFALALLCRLNFLPLLLLVPLYFRMQKPRPAGWIRSSALFLMPSVLALGFLCLRNLSIQGRFTPLTMNPGTVFFEGNNPNSLGQSSIYPPLVYDLADEFPGQPDFQHSLYRLLARRDSGREMDIAGVNRFWSGKALNYIRDHPWRFLRSLGAKTNYFFHGFRRHDLAPAFWGDRKLQRARIPTVPFPLVSALAILGLFLARREWKQHLLFYGVLFTQLAVLLATYVSARQRIAVYPVFIFFACRALRAIASWGRRPLQALAVAGVIGLSLPLAIENDAMREETHQWRSFRLSRGLYDQAKQRRQNGSWSEAAVSAARALAAAPWLADSLRPTDLDFGPCGFAGSALAIHETLAAPDFSSRFDRGTLALAAQELNKARDVFSRLEEEGHSFKRDYDQSSQPSFYLAKIAWKNNDRPAALAHLARARKDAPGDPEVLALSFALTGRSGFSERIERYFDGPDRDFLIGRTFLEIGEAKRALPYLQRLGKLLPEYRRGRIYLAAALAGSGRHEEGAEIYFAALAKRRDPVFLQEEIVGALRGWTEARPAEARSWFFSGLALRQFGLHSQAMEAQLAARALSPGHPLIEKEIRRLEEIRRLYLPDRRPKKTTCQAAAKIVK